MFTTRLGFESGSREFMNYRIRDKYSRFAETNPNCTDEGYIAKLKFDDWLAEKHLSNPFSLPLFGSNSLPRFDHKQCDRLGLPGVNGGEI